MMQSARRNHLGAGVLAPVRCCDGAVGVFGVGFSSDEYTPSRQSHLERVAPYVSYLGAYIQQVMVEQSGLGESNRKTSLTEREKACLSWAADGHTASEIATKLFVETCTVKFHLRNVIRKMGAKNTTQALALAIVKGYIKPSHGNG
jgi:DNA-binding CsgD family transcriptional regulator